MPAHASWRSRVPRYDITDILIVLGLTVASACSSDHAVDPANATPSIAFGIWNPGPNDTCTKEQHDAYAVVGPDGKLYPTWHPATGPGGCTFGHEHGRDPRGSDLYDETGGLPFGMANEALSISDPANPRNEDHFGHKVEWENDVELQFSGAGSAIFTLKCDVLTKLHQGTHSKDAFTNNLHELVYHIHCSDGTEMHVTMLTAIGTPGEFVRSCDHSVHITLPMGAASGPSRTAPVSSSSCWCRRASSPISRPRCMRRGRRRTASGGRTVTASPSSIPISR